ncbi:MAG: InlB B-repeat-containing protein, partial [Chitinispirillaceae bacterium]|nr:InlB B-repeat-containing protein [Chitinispirillaceae bacterium]
TLSFNGNGNTSGEIPELKKYDYHAIVTIPANGTLKKDGYTFTGWNSAQNGNGKAFAVADTFSMPSSEMVLYAQWQALPTYRISYNKNGADSGAVPVDSNTYYKGEEVTVAGNPGKLSKSSASFSGWNTKTDGTGESYNAGAKFPMPDSAVMLYVKWTTNPIYSIIYHSVSSTGGNVPSVVNADTGTQVTIADSGSLYKTGYSFVGWNSKEDGSGKLYKTGDKVTIGAVNIDLYVQWTKASYTVTYHGNGNTGGTVPQKTTHLYQTEIELALAGTIERIGYTFQNWNTDSAGNGIDYSGGSKLVIDKNIDLHARWTKNKYKVYYIGNGNDGGNPPPPVEYEYNSIVTIAGKETLFKTGYSFNGWNRLKTGTSPGLLPNATFSMQAFNDTLYAMWSSPQGMVKINAKEKQFLFGHEMYTSPVSRVTFSNNFWIDSTEITQSFYTSIMEANYSQFSKPDWNTTYGKGNRYPAYYVSWFDAVLFCNARTKATGSNDTVYSYTSVMGTPGNGCVLNGMVSDLTKRGFRLPTEAQWEYSCRAETTTDYYWLKNYDPYPMDGNDSSEIDANAIWENNSGKFEAGNSSYGTHQVATKTKNNYNLYDMIGNVYEWCNDWYSAYTIDAKRDPAGTVNGVGKIVRGGAWNSSPIYLRSDYRFYSNIPREYGVTPDQTSDIIGFRTCIPISD